ncbi:hypothetical protein BH23GEM2_BH23GEM2_22690 [soil metagenome]
MQCFVQFVTDNMAQLPGQTAPDAVADLSRVLREGGVYAALRFLNDRTRHRYTGAYLFDPPRLVNYCLFDRDNPGVRSMSDLVLRDSYCALVAEDGEEFITNDALRDRRLASHPKQRLTVAYHGHALRDDTGECFGSLCHWDTRPRLLAATEAPLLRAAAGLIARVVCRDTSLDLLLSANAAKSPAREGLSAR